MQDATLRSRAKEIFLDALEEPQERRAAFVLRATDGDVALRDAVERLMGGHERADAVEGWIPRRARADDGLDVGDVLGSYELLAEIDSGAAGRVFRARQEGLEREVALKVPNSGRFASAGEVARFRREAEAVARLDHANIVPVYDVDEADGRHFFSMKLVEGGSLAERSGEFADPAAAAALVETVARAVHHGHQRGILHRDIKPSNILLDRRARPFVADFGIAARLGAADDATHVAVAGTPAYMAPEQATPDGEPTTASDVWALGCVLFELVEGAPPFRGSDVTDSLRRAREEATPSIERARAHLPRGRAADLEAIIRRCLEKAPAERYGSARALAEDLRRWLALHPVSVRTPPFAERMQLRWRRQPYAYSFAAVIALLVLAIAAVAPLVSVELGRRLKRAERAEDVARTRLRSALLAQAEATRQSATPGRRARAMGNLAEAAAIAPGTDLRDEAIRALARFDLDVDFELPIELAVETALCADGAGRVALVAHRDGSARVVDLTNGEAVCRLRAPSGQFWNAVLSSDGRWLIARSHGKSYRDDPIVTLFDAISGEAKWSWRESILVSRFDFDPTRDRVAITLDDRTIAIVACETGEVAARIEVGHTVSDVDFTDDGDTLYVGTGTDKGVARVDVETGSVEAFVEALPHSTSSIDLGPGGERMIVGLYGPEARLIDLTSGDVLVQYRGHAAEVASVSFVEADLVATSAWDGLTRLWNASSGELVLEWPGRILFGVRGDTGVIVAMSGDRIVRHVISRTSVVRELSGHAGKSPRGLACPDGGEWVATGAVDGLRLWDPLTGALLAHVDVEGDEIMSMAVSPDGAWLYSSNDHGVVRHDVAKLVSGEFAAATPVVERRTEEISLSRDGRRLAVVRPYETVELYDLTTEPPRHLRTLEGPGRISGIELSPDGSRLVSSAWRGRGLRCWDTNAAEVLFDRHREHRQLNAGFDADGDRIFAVLPGALHVWDLAGESLFEEPLPNSRSFTSAGRVHADPTGRWLAAVIDRESIELRNATTLEVEAHLWLDGTPLQALRFVPGTALLAAGTTDGRALVWDLEQLDEQLAQIGLGLSEH